MKNVKRFKKAAIFLMAFVMAASTLNVSAAVTYKKAGKTVRYRGASYKVYYNGKRVNSSKRPALYINKNIMVPYQNALVKNGPKISYAKSNNGNTLTLTHNGNKIILKINKKYAYVNGKYQKLRTAPFKAKVSGTTVIMVPSRVVSEALGIGYTYSIKKHAAYLTEKNMEPVTTNAPSVSVSTNNLQAVAFKSMNTQQFIDTLGPIAREDCKKTGVLASVTLAQAINESGWGKSGLAQSSNNMFGMKTSLSGNNWTGSTWDGSFVTVKTTEEDKKGKKYVITAKFRKYSSVAQSVADHSAYLSNAMNGSYRRYYGLTATKDYKQQLSILQKGGYCTWSGYVNELSYIIEHYNLTKWDY